MSLFLCLYCIPINQTPSINNRHLTLKSLTMNTILIPTDFSEAANHAVDYAIEIGRQTNAKIVLFHVYQIPVVSSEIPVVFPINEIEETAMHSLQNIKRTIHEKHGQEIEIECLCRYGFPVDEITKQADQLRVSLIVMGMKGMGYLAEKLFGSTVTSLIKKIKQPVLVIGEKVSYKPIQKIVLACDYMKFQNQTVFMPLKELTALFQAHIYVLNVVKDLQELTTVSKAVEGIKLNHSLEGVHHSFHQAENDDIIDGINGFVEQEHADMLAMIPHKHNILGAFFHEPNTKQMAFHAKVPLLILNGPID